MVWPKTRCGKVQGEFWSSLGPKRSSPSLTGSLPGHLGRLLEPSQEAGSEGEAKGVSA